MTPMFGDSFELTNGARAEGYHVQGISIMKTYISIYEYHDLAMRFLYNPSLLYFLGTGGGAMILFEGVF